MPSSNDDCEPEDAHHREDSMLADKLSRSPVEVESDLGKAMPIAVAWVDEGSDLGRGRHAEPASELGETNNG